MNLESNQKNNTWIDSIKLFLIFFVILGHTIEKCKFGGFTNEIHVFNLITLFHMPMFLFVSGFLTHVKDRTHYWKSVLRILETFLVFDLIRLLIDGNYSFASLLSPKWTLWYLLTLAYYRSIAFMLRKVKRNALVAFSLVASLAGGAICIGAALSFQRTLTFMPFFMLGFVMSRDSIGIEWIRRIPKIVSIVIIVVAIVFFWSYDNSLVPLFAGSYPYSASSIVNIGTRSIQLCCAFLVGIAILSLIPDLKQYSKIGKRTLFIYMYHTFMIQLVFAPLTKLLGHDSFIVLFLCSLCNLFLLIFLSNVKILNILLNPISFYFEHKGESHYC